MIHPGQVVLVGVVSVAFGCAPPRIADELDTTPAAQDGKRTVGLDARFEGWRTVTWVYPPARSEAAMAYDATRDEVILFGGADVALRDDTWIFKHGRWSAPQLDGVLPPARSHSALVHDPVRGVVVMFGGWSGSDALGDTWEWDGGRWSLVTSTEDDPSPRHRHAMLYDPQLGEVLLFGGAPANDETWSFDGTRWLRQEVTEAPPGRADAAMGWDPVRGQLLMLGGYALTDEQSTLLGDTWQWDGAAWTQLRPDWDLPIQRRTMFYDESLEALAVLGNGSSARYWTGEAWNEGPLPFTYLHRMLYASGYAAARDTVRQATIFFGTRAGGNVTHDMWFWNGGNWSFPYPDVWSPATAYDTARGELVVFGGTPSFHGALDDTWTWDGVGWELRTPPHAPSPRDFGAMAYDPIRERIVLHSGQLAESFGDPPDTWEWDGNDWQRMETAAPVPEAIGGFKMAHDPVHGGVLLFGGNGSSNLNETWRWDGAAWERLYPTVSPSARFAFGMATDERRGRVVVFGGNHYNLITGQHGVLSDTWEWDGVTWSPRASPVRPTPRGYHAMTYDPFGGVVLLSGGSPDGSVPLDDLWAWDGTTWAPWETTDAPPALTNHIFAVDRARGTLVMKGRTDAAEDARTWTLALERLDGSDCGGDEECRSGICEDGVCCATTCGDDAGDCQACNLAESRGTCTIFPADTVCRAASDLCDHAELCDGTSTRCPDDTVLPPGAECRAPVHSCDQPEVCDGEGVGCPDDVAQPGGSECRPAGGACDVAEECDGTMSPCPDDVLAADGADCSDGRWCTGEERCESGACVTSVIPDCADDDACTEDLCGEDGGCTHPRIPGCCRDDADCPAAGACTTTRCSNQVCVLETIDDCCDSPADCDDGDDCTSDTCEAGACVRVDICAPDAGSSNDAAGGSDAAIVADAAPGGGAPGAADCACVTVARVPPVAAFLLLATISGRRRRRC